MKLGALVECGQCPHRSHHHALLQLHELDSRHALHDHLLRVPSLLQECLEHCVL